MKLSLHSLQLPLIRPFVTSHGSLQERSVLLLSLRDGTLHAFGEAAPLPSFGTEDLPHAEAALRAYLTAFMESDVGMRDGDVPAPPDHVLTPCASYAVESLLLDAMARGDGLPVHTYLSDPPEDGIGEEHAAASVPVNAVVGCSSAAETAAAVAHARTEGFHCVKLKVGAADSGEDVRRVAAAREAAGTDMSLRLDANGAWTLEQARRMLDRLARFDIEYVEQPIAPGAMDDWLDLRAHAAMPLAVDEGIRCIEDAWRLLKGDAADVFILKPMALGSVLRTRMFAMEAAARQRRVVFTSLIESAVGRAMTAHIAASLPMHPGPHGLATGSLFARDTAVDDVRDGILHLCPGPGIGIQPSIPDDAS
jgi:L-Ala-D/L-Glu epimerase